MKSASGMVVKMVKVPHALSASALTTTRPRPSSDDDDEEHGDGRGGAGERPDLRAGDVGERGAAAPRRRPEDDEVVHRAREADAGHEPDQTWRIAELRGQHRADQGPGTGDGGEVMAEEDPARRRVVIVAVVARVGRGDPGIVEHEHAGGDEGAVVAVGDGQVRAPGSGCRRCAGSDFAIVGSRQ
jgi:hypothetical protein